MAHDEISQAVSSHECVPCTNIDIGRDEKTAAGCVHKILTLSENTCSEFR